MNVRHLNQREREIYTKARDVLQRGIGAMEFSALFFDPQGELRVLWSDADERRTLTQSPLYKWLQQSLTALRQAEVEQFDREVEPLSGRLTIVVPKSLHAALKGEAAHEGVSLSELIRLKLGVPYASLTKQFVVANNPRAKGKRGSPRKRRGVRP